jgi:hypothetical protein
VTRPHVQAPSKRPFAKLYHDFIDMRIEPLSNGGTRLYLGLLRRYNGHNGGGISFSVREAAAWCGCGYATAISYFKELQDHGLIEPVLKGSFAIKAGARKNLATTWRLSFVEGAAG